MKLPNSGKKIKMALIALLVFILGVILYAFYLNRTPVEDYITPIIFLVVVGFAAWFGLAAGLLFSLFGVIAYGAFFFIGALIRHVDADISGKEAVWLILIPAGALIGGYLGDAIIFVEKLFNKYIRQIESLLLTGQLGMIGNEVTFQTGLKEECSRAKRSLSHFTVLLMDVKNMDQLQKMLGLDAHEQIADKISEGLSRSTRDIDKKARLDGTLHGVILPECPKENVQIVIDRIQKNLNQVDVSYQNRSIKVDVVLAFGRATYPEDGDTPEKMMEHAKVDLAENQKK